MPAFGFTPLFALPVAGALFWAAASATPCFSPTEGFSCAAGVAGWVAACRCGVVVAVEEDWAAGRAAAGDDCLPCSSWAKPPLDWEPAGAEAGALPADGAATGAASCIITAFGIIISVITPSFFQL